MIEGMTVPIKNIRKRINSIVATVVNSDLMTKTCN